MFINNAMRRAEKFLRESDERFRPVKIAPVQLDLAFGPKQALNDLVAKRFRNLLEGPDGSLVLTLLHSLVLAHPIIAGRGTDKKGRTVVYGIDSAGPCRVTYKPHKKGSKDEIDHVDQISPEELLLHTEKPREFENNVFLHLDAAAKKILERSRTVEGRV